MMKNKSILSAYLQNVFLITWHIYIAFNAIFLIVMGGFDWYLTETFAIEEYIPSGWTVIGDGGGATTNPNKLAWVVIQYAEDTKYTYTINITKFKQKSIR